MWRAKGAEHEPQREVAASLRAVAQHICVALGMFQGVLEKSPYLKSSYLRPQNSACN